MLPETALFAFYLSSPLLRFVLILLFLQLSDKFTAGGYN